MAESKFKETKIGLIPENWQKKSLGELVTFKRGHDLPIKNRKEGKYPVIASNGNVGFHDEFKAAGPGVTIGRSGNLGKPFFIEGNYWPLNTTLYSIKFHESDPKFVYYFLKTLPLHEFNSGSAVPSLNRNLIHPIEIVVPKKPEQVKIAKVLSYLDAKIELNQKMNQTLEEIGQAIFKHWFVHFEFPNEEGNPYKSNGGEMVDSELGEIPKGWEVKKLSEICSKVIDGTHDSPSPEDEGYYLVTGRHIINGIIDFSKCYKISPEEHQKVMMRSKPEKGDTIFSNIGTLGTATFVDQDFEFSIKNVALFKPLKPIYSSFIYLYFLFPNTVKIMENSSSGTTQRFFSLKFLRGWELIKPSDGILLKFDNFIQPLLEMRTSLNAQNKNLSQIRDSLLPKLMSGKIRVK